MWSLHRPGRCSSWSGTSSARPLTPNLPGLTKNDFHSHLRLLKMRAICCGPSTAPPLQYRSLHTMTAHATTAPQIAVRTATALLGGYAFSWGFIAFGMALFFTLGMEFHDAESLASILGLLFFLGNFLWAFSARRLWPVWLVLFCMRAVIALAATLLQARLVAYGALSHVPEFPSFHDLAAHLVRPGAGLC